MFAPILPYISETLYQQLYRANEEYASIHSTLFDDERYGYTFEPSAALIDNVLGIITTVRKLKSEGKYSLRTELNKLILYSADEVLTGQLQLLEALICGVTRAQAVEFVSQDLESARLTADGDSLIAHVRV